MSFAPRIRPRNTPFDRKGLAAATRLYAVTWLLLCGPILGCFFSGWIPDEGPSRKPEAQPRAEPLIQLPLGEKRDATLNCPAGDCGVRYVVDTPDHGSLRVRLDPHFANDDVGLRVLLEDPFGAPLADVPARGDTEVDFTRPVKPGPYVVFVQSIGGQVDYELVADWQKGPGPAPVAPTDQPPTPPLNQGEVKHGYGADAAYNPEIDFTRYRYYAFAEVPQDRLNAPPGESVGNPFLDAAIQRAIALEFIERGFVVAKTPEDADFLVSTHVGTRARTYWAIGLDNFSRSYTDFFNQWGALGAPVSPHTYRKGTLVIDFIDVERRELSWHGWSSETVSPIMDRNDLIRQMVAAILNDFPPARPTLE